MGNRRLRGSPLHEDDHRALRTSDVEREVEEGLNGGGELIEALTAQATASTMRKAAIGRHQRAHGNQSAQRMLRRVATSVMRDDDKSVASPAAAPVAVPSGPTPTPPAGVTTNWFVDYQYLPIAGSAPAPKTRSPESALYVDELKTWPDGATAPLPTLSGVNAAESGKVGLGTLSHPDQKGGKVSGKVRFGAKPNLDVKLDFTQETNLKVKSKYTKEKKDTLKKISAELNKLLKTEAASKSSVAQIEALLQAKAESLLPPGSDSHGYQVKVIVEPKPGPESAAKVLETVSYPAAKEGANYDVLVDVPLETAETQWSKNTTEKESQKSNSAASATTAGSTKTTISDTERAKIQETARSTVTTALKSLWQKQKTRLKSDRSYKEESSKTTLSGEHASKLALKVSAKEFPLPGVGKVLKLLLKIDGEANGEMTTKLGAGYESSNKSGSESTDSITDSELSSMEEAVTKSVESYVSTEVEKVLTKQIEDTFSVSGTVSMGEEQGGEKSIGKTVAGKTVSYKTGVPKLKIQ